MQDHENTVRTALATIGRLEAEGNLDAASIAVATLLAEARQVEVPDVLIADIENTESRILDAIERRRGRSQSMPPTMGEWF